MLVTKMLDSLEERREILYLRFAKQCLRHEKLKDVFPPKNSKSSNEKRNGQRFVVEKTLTEKYKRSPLLLLSMRDCKMG